jgi:hypothetical protein
MPKMPREVGKVYYNPSIAGLVIKEPKSPGSVRNTFLQKLRKDLRGNPLFQPGCSTLTSAFGGGVNQMRSLYAEALKRERKATLTEAQRKGLAKGQEMMRQGRLSKPTEKAREEAAKRKRDRKDKARAEQLSGVHVPRRKTSSNRAPSAPKSSAKKKKNVSFQNFRGLDFDD